MVSARTTQIRSHRFDQTNYTRALPATALRYSSEKKANDSRLEIEQAASLALEPLPHGLINADLGLSFWPLILALISTFSYRMKENRVLAANERIRETGMHSHDDNKT